MQVIGAPPVITYQKVEYSGQVKFYSPGPGITLIRLALARASVVCTELQIGSYEALTERNFLIYQLRTAQLYGCASKTTFTLSCSQQVNCFHLNSRRHVSPSSVSVLCLPPL